MKYALVLAVLFSLAACGDNNNVPDTTPIGPFGISGSGWLGIFIVGIIALGSIGVEFARAWGRRRGGDD
jgi:hypothetical protein